MFESSIWLEPQFLQTVFIVTGFLIISGISFFYLQKIKPQFKPIWISLKGWFFLAPLFLTVFALPQPWPLIAITLMSIYSSKTFFKVVGMYHRHWFVLTTYFFIILMSWLIHSGYSNSTINLIPIIFLTTICLIPILSNNYKNMIQYIALTFLGFTFLGWSILHFGQLMKMEHGIYIVICLFFLSEFNDFIYWSANRLCGKTKFLSQLDNRITVEGLLISTALTFSAAWGLKYLLPEGGSIAQWVVAGFTICIFGRMGDLVMTVLRKDLGIKHSSIFIMGRDDLLARADKMIFVAPAYYYIFILLENQTLF